MGGMGVADAVSMVKGSVGGDSPYTRSRNGLKILLPLFEMVQVTRDKIIAAGTLRVGWPLCGFCCRVSGCCGRLKNLAGDIEAETAHHSSYLYLYLPLACYLGMNVTSSNNTTFTLWYFATSLLTLTLP